MKVELVELVAILLCIVILATIRAAAAVMPSIAQCLNEARLAKLDDRKYEARHDEARGCCVQGVVQPPPMPVRRPPPPPRG
jgi:hypothetical protein